MVESLPLELILHIIRLAIEDDEAYSTATYATLRSFSLVSKIWACFAQDELFRDVLLPHTKALSAFTAVTYSKQDPRDTQNAPRLARDRTRSLAVARPDESSGETKAEVAVFTQLVIAVPGLTRLTLSNMSADCAMLSWAAHLVFLKLHETKIVFALDAPISEHHPRLWRLPRLTHLEAKLITIEPLHDDESAGINRDGMFLNTLAFPSLRRLTWVWDMLSEFPNLSAELAGQLDVLLLRRMPVNDDDGDDIFPMFPPALFPSLARVQHLAMDLKYRDDINVLDDLPSRLLSLRLDGRRHTIFEQIGGNYFRCMDGLPELHLRSVSEEDDLDEMCDARKIFLVEFPFHPTDPDEAITDWLASVEQYDERSDLRRLRFEEAEAESGDEQGDSDEMDVEDTG